MLSDLMKSDVGKETGSLGPCSRQASSRPGKAPDQEPKPGYAIKSPPGELSTDPAPSDAGTGGPAWDLGAGIPGKEGLGNSQSTLGNAQAAGTPSEEAGSCPRSQETRKPARGPEPGPCPPGLTPWQSRGSWEGAREAPRARGRGPFRPLGSAGLGLPHWALKPDRPGSGREILRCTQHLWPCLFSPWAEATRNSAPPPGMRGKAGTPATLCCQEQAWASSLQPLRIHAPSPPPTPELMYSLHGSAHCPGSSEGPTPLCPENL